MPQVLGRLILTRSDFYPQVFFNLLHFFNHFLVACFLGLHFFLLRHFSIIVSFSLKIMCLSGYRGPHYIHSFSFASVCLLFTPSPLLLDTSKLSSGESRFDSETSVAFCTDGAADCGPSYLRSAPLCCC